MRFGEIKNKPVVSVGGAEKLGFLDDVLLDTANERVLGFQVRRGGILTHRDAMLLTDVRSIGLDAVTVQDASRLNAQNKFSELANAVSGDDVIGSRVMSESGEELGSVGDIDADFEKGNIERYILQGSLLDRIRHDQQSFPVSVVKSVGQKLIVIADGATIS